MRRLLRRVGRRGASLLFVGALSLVVSSSLAWAPPELLNTPALLALSSLAPLRAWAVAWAASGVVAFAQAFGKQDRVAFALLAAMWWLYGIAYIVGVFTGVNPRGWVGGLIWAGFGGWLTLISTWPEAGPSPLPGPIGNPGDAVIAADGDGVIRAWNAAAETMFGWAASEVVGMASVDVIIPPDLREHHHRAVHKARLRGELSARARVLDTRALHRDGTVFRVETTLGMAPTSAGPVFSAVIRRAGQG